jgi:hypothetical protein
VPVTRHPVGRAVRLVQFRHHCRHPLAFSAGKAKDKKNR